LNGKVDLTVYLKDADTTDQVSALQQIIQSRPEVKNVTFISKAQALVIWQKSHADNSDIANVISATDNPLPSSFDVQTTNPSEIETVANFLDSQDYAPLIQEINYQQTKDVVDRLIRITYFLQLFGWSLSALFTLISILIVYNTLRLTIFARSDEIEIMRLVGASDAYVRGPFVIEGIAYGFFGAIVAALLFYALASLVISPIQNYLGIADLRSVLSINLWMIILLQFAIGIMLGLVCSFFAVRKYLVEKKTK